MIRRLLHKNRTSISTTHFSVDWMGVLVDQEEWVQEADVIHLHWVAETLSSASLGGLTKLRKPVVWTLHDLRPLTGGCHFSAGCQQFLEGCGFCPQLQTDFFQVTARSLSAMAGAVDGLKPHFVAPSSWMGEQVRASRIGRNHTLSVIPYGIDSALFCPGSRQEARRELGLPETEPLILLAGHSLIEKRKGFEHAMRVLSLFRRKMQMISESGAQEGKPALLIAGKDAEDLHLPGWTIHRAGLIPAARMPLLYRAANVLLFTSTEDNLPNVILEAMSCGLPVVAHRVGGVPDLLGGDDPCGILFAPDMPEEGAWGLSQLCSDSDLSKSLALGGVKKIQRGFTLTHQAQRHAGLYRSLPAPASLSAGGILEGANCLRQVPSWRFWIERFRCGFSNSTSIN
jgi:glycosyltransferase involved in cell wall biosynthesis